MGSALEMRERGLTFALLPLHNLYCVATLAPPNLSYVNGWGEVNGQRFGRVPFPVPPAIFRIA
jgi:hypothetical protein